MSPAIPVSRPVAPCRVHTFDSSSLATAEHVLAVPSLVDAAADDARPQAADDADAIGSQAADDVDDTGSAAADDADITDAADDVAPGTPRCTTIVVVSALAGTTDALVAMAAAAAAGERWTEAWEALCARHLDVARVIARHTRSAGPGPDLGAHLAALHRDMTALARGGSDAETMARIYGAGDLLSVCLVHAALGGVARDWRCLDTRSIVTTRAGRGGVDVDWRGCRARFSDWWRANGPCHIVATELIARRPAGEDALRGPNSSANAGAILEALVAEEAGLSSLPVPVTHADGVRVVRAARTAARRSRQAVSVGVIGTGRVGRALIEQLCAAALLWRRGLGPEVHLLAVANSRQMVLGGCNQDSASLLQHFSATARQTDLDAFTTHVRQHLDQSAVIIDCTAADAVAERYAGWLRDGVHVVTANKHAGSGSLARYAAIRAAAASSGASFRYEATVGAGLPVIQTLRTLVDTGDVLNGVEGMLSGTLAWLLHSFDGTRPFSALVREAHALGYTEPDPRDDLSGMDVARKLVILAREAGRSISLEDVSVEGLLPAHLASVPVEALMARLDELDGSMRERFDAARRRGGGLRHVARLREDGQPRVGLAALEPGHPCLHARLADNVVQFTTARYPERPLVVQGPGAGPVVAAAGVLGDLLAVARATAGIA